MRKFGTLMTTVLVAAGTGWISFGQPGYLHADDNQMKMTETKTTEVKVDRAEPKMMVPGLPRVDSTADQASARRVLAQASKAALGPNSLKNVSDLLVSNDKERIQSGSADTAKLDSTAEQLRNAWKEKYGSDFTIANPETALDYSKDAPAGQTELGATPRPMNATGGVENRGGARSDPAQFTDRTFRRTEPGAKATKTETDMTASADANKTAGEVRVNGEAGEVKIDTNGARVDATGREAKGPAAEGQVKISETPRSDVARNDANMDAAQPAGARVEANSTEMKVTNTDAKAQRTTYWIPASHGLPAAFVTLTSEGDAWKVNLNDSVDANRLTANLNEQLSAILSKKDQWPSDAAEAQRIVAHHIAFALSDHLGEAPAQ